MTKETVLITILPPQCVEMLLDMEMFSENILEPCAGGGHISEVLKSRGFNVKSNDMFYHGYELDTQEDFMNIPYWNGDIITNPPYNKAKDFVCHALDIVPKGNKVAMLLKLTFLEGKSRRKLFETKQLKTVYVSTSRIICGKNGVFGNDSAIAFAWFIFEKGYFNNPIIKWFN